LIVVAGMGPITAIKYLRFSYMPSRINVLQQSERDPAAATTAARNNSSDGSSASVYEPLLSCDESSSSHQRRPSGVAASFDAFLRSSFSSSGYPANCKDK
ncbi:hypothetical protein M569_09120, partial [Genlisea aurea]